MEKLVNGNEEDYRDRLREFFEFSGINPNYFVRKGIFSNGSINKLLNKDTDASVSVVLKILETFPELNANWLLTGEGLMIRSVRDNVIHEVVTTSMLKRDARVEVAEELRSFIAPINELVERAQLLGLNVHFLIETGVETGASLAQGTDTLKVVDVSVWEKVTY